MIATFVPKPETVFGDTCEVKEFAPLYNENSTFHNAGAYLKDEVLYNLDYEQPSIPLPYGMNNLGYIHRVAVHNGKLIYLTSADVSKNVPSHIYLCDRQGKNNVHISENVAQESKIYISKNHLFYAALFNPSMGYYGGVYKINLEDLSYEKILNEPAEISYFDGELLYLKNNNDYFAIDANGNNRIKINSNCDEYAENVVIKDNEVYYVSNNFLYARIKNGNDAIRIAVVRDNSYPVFADEDYIYYAYNYTNEDANANEIENVASFNSVSRDRSGMEQISLWEASVLALDKFGYSDKPNVWTTPLRGFYCDGDEEKLWHRIIIWTNVYDTDVKLRRVIVSPDGSEIFEGEYDYSTHEIIRY